MAGTPEDGASAPPRALDVSDPDIRDMAKRHAPYEMWTLGGDLYAPIRCDTCHQEWPCETRKALRALHR